MLPLSFLLAWAGLWAAARLLLSLLSPSIVRRFPEASIDLEWWRVTVRHTGDGGAGLFSRLASRHRRALRRWFSVGAVAGLVAGACSVALLSTELWTLLRGLAPAAVGGAEAAAAAAAAGGGRGAAAPRLQLALPGVTLPASHAVPLWLALASSLTLHEAGHALAAAAEGVQVTGAGFSLLLLLPAAFVQLDSADLASLGRHSMLRVAAAGAWHNAALAAACRAATALWHATAGSSSGSNPALLLVQLLLGYTVSLSAALALLNMAPVWYLDGQQALEALLLRPRKQRDLPEQQQQQQECADGHASSSSGSSSSRFNVEEGGEYASGGGSGRRRAVRWALHGGTALYAAVLALHLLQMR